MTHYNNYKTYHEALKNTSFEALSGIIFNMQSISKKYNSELSNINNSEWQDKVNPVLQQKLSFSLNAIQSLNNDIALNIHSMIDNGSKLLEILEQMQQKQITIDGLTSELNDLNQEKNSAHNKLNSFKDKTTEEYNAAYSKYSNVLNRYNNKKAELTTSQNGIDELGIEADKLITKLKEISFTANIAGLLNGTVTEVSTSVPVTTPSPTSQPTIAPTTTPKPTPEASKSTMHFDNSLAERLGIQFDKNNEPLMKGNAYVAYHNGMGYLVYFPKDSNGNIKANLPVMVEFHGSGEVSKTKSKNTAQGLPTDRMGLYQIGNNPNTQAIIIIPRSPNDTWGVYNKKEGKIIQDQVKSIQDNVIDSLRANKNKIILYGHSAGGRGELEYAAAYPDGIKCIVSMDGRPNSEVVQKVADLKIPVLYITSQNAGEVESLNKPSYFNATNKIMKSIDIDYSFETVATKSLDSKTISSETLAAKAKVESILTSVVNNKETALVHLMGSSHRTVRDFTTQIVDFFDILLK